MKLPNRVKNILLVFVLLLSVSAVFYKLSQYEIIRSYLVRWSDLDNIGPNLYVDPNMPESQQQALISSLPVAKEHIATLYGEYTADPVIIAGHTMEVMKAYGGNSYNRAGRTYTTLLASIIILGPEGALSEDVLSYELAHVEFSTRIGHGNRDEIPSWFDEGLAVQFDERFSEAEWQARADEGNAAFDLDNMEIIEHNDWQEYANSKHEVRRWLGVVGQEGFQEFLQAIRSGEDFQKTYRMIEEVNANIR
ncbi:MAG: hypothetical protein WA996_05845 [Candidatus Promineifilaceae bacterium]